MVSDKSNNDHSNNNKKRKKQPPTLTNHDSNKQKTTTEKHEDSDSGSEHECHSADAVEVLNSLVGMTNDEEEVWLDGFHMARNSTRDFLKSCVF